LGYDFPGNVRELENMIERAVVTAGVEILSPTNLFGNAANASSDEVNANKAYLDLPFKDAIAALERELIRRGLEASGGNRTEAARRLGINRRLLYSKMEEHGIEP
jgi:two-component system NtrC family response regulator